MRHVAESPPVFRDRHDLGSGRQLDAKEKGGRASTVVPDGAVEMRHASPERGLGDGT
jgi:hypothetical protein